MRENEKTCCGYVVVIGKPNVGKSTLMNQLLKTNLSIVTRKAQTTRNTILGILTENYYQIVFLDTPGILKPKYELQRFMVSEITSSLREADIILQIMDASDIGKRDTQEGGIDDKELIKDKKLIIVLNKIDLISKEDVLKAISVLNTKFNYENIVPISALNATNIEELKNLIVASLPESHFLYDKETLTDKPEKFFVTEIIRQKILELFHEEIPYSVFVVVREFKERKKGKDYINAEIILERESQKVILLGKKGEKIKKLGRLARKDIESFLGKDVYLELFVKIRKDWRKDKKFIKDNLT